MTIIDKRKELVYFKLMTYHNLSGMITWQSMWRLICAFLSMTVDAAGKHRYFRNRENLQYKKIAVSVLLSLLMKTNKKYNYFYAS